MGENVFGHVETFPDLLVILSLLGIAERLVHALTNVGVTGMTGILLRVIDKMGIACLVLGLLGSILGHGLAYLVARRYVLLGLRSLGD